MSEALYRCRHCRGFYETALPRCKWCGYETPMAGADGQPMIYASRELARAVQLAEYEQLPAAAHADGMGPPKNNLTLRCSCLHCGPDGHVFEAVEMRWIVNERMWACPCTTCGGRGFGIDIHPIERVWQCAECGHWYTPEKFTSKYAKCPQCGSRHANGWFDDAGEDGEPLTEEEWERLYGGAADAELGDAAEAGEGSTTALPETPEAEDLDLPAKDAPWVDDVKPFDPAHPNADDDDLRAGEGPGRDDIDFPHHDRPPRTEGEAGPGDLPF